MSELQRKNKHNEQEEDKKGRRSEKLRKCT